MKRNLLLTASVLSCFYLPAQIVRTPVGSVYTKLNAYSSQFNDAFSFTANQGSLATMKKFSIGIFSERRFMLQDLSSYSMAFVLPTASGNFGVKADYNGSQLYNETSAGLAYARSLGKTADVGVQFNYFSMKASTYGAASTINFDAGVLFHLTSQINAGVHVYNPVAMKLGKDEEEKLPSIFSAGLGYDASTKFFIGAEAEKIEDQSITVNAGMHYVLADKIIVRGGVSSAASIYYLGFGVQLKNLRLDATATFHPYLGTTPGLLLLYANKE